MNLNQARETLGKHFALILDTAEPLIRHLDLPKDARILDVGTGHGHFAIALALHGYAVLTGEPASDESVYARRDWQDSAKAVGVEDSIRFQPLEAQQLPFDDESYDAIFFFGVLHHIDASLRDAVLQETTRVAKTGGCICFIEPTMGCVESIRAEYPTHPDPADPTAHALDLCLKIETLPGDMFIHTILRKQ